MEPLTVILLILGLVIAGIGGIWLLVAAFKENIWWGLSTLFVPFAGLIFVIVHWSKARTPFVLNILGAVMIAGSVVASPSIQQMYKGGLAAASASSEQQASAQDLTAKIQQKRDEIELGERQFRAESVTLTQEFQQLQARRAKLKPGENDAITAFNAEAAAYQKKSAALKELRAKLDTTQMELTTLLDERSRQGANGANGANGAAAHGTASGKRVVMYTTSHCPACKAAKSYMARKGVTFEERDVEHSPDARAEFDRLGGRGVPLILVGEQRMEGFSSQRLDQLL